MKKKALILLLIPTASVLLTGCKVLDSVKSARRKVIDATRKAKHAVDDFFREPAENKTASGVAYSLSFHK